MAQSLACTIGLISGSGGNLYKQVIGRFPCFTILNDNMLSNKIIKTPTTARNQTHCACLPRAALLCGRSTHRVFELELSRGVPLNRCRILATSRCMQMVYETPKWTPASLSEIHINWPLGLGAGSPTFSGLEDPRQHSPLPPPPPPSCFHVAAVASLQKSWGLWLTTLVGILEQGAFWTLSYSVHTTEQN